MKPSTLGRRLTELRKARGLSQAAVAKELGLTQVLVSNYENDQRRLHAELIVRFARFYDVSADALLGLDRERTAGRGAAADLGLHLLRRMRKIQRLPKQRQKEVLRSLDLLLRGATRREERPEVRGERR